MKLTGQLKQEDKVENKAHNRCWNLSCFKINSVQKNHALLCSYRPIEGIRSFSVLIMPCIIIYCNIVKSYSYVFYDLSIKLKKKKLGILFCFKVTKRFGLLGFKKDVPEYTSFSSIDNNLNNAAKSSYISCWFLCFICVLSRDDVGAELCCNDLSRNSDFGIHCL